MILLAASSELRFLLTFLSFTFVSIMLQESDQTQWTWDQQIQQEYAFFQFTVYMILFRLFWFPEFDKPKHLLICILLSLECGEMRIGQSYLKWNTFELWITKVFDKQLRIKSSDIKEWRFDGSILSFSHSNKIHYVSSLYSECTCEGLSAYD